MASAAAVFAVIAVILSVLIYLQVKPIFEVPPIPKLEDTWWGPRDPSKEDTNIKPFKINVSDEILKDLQQRLANALPFQDPLEGVKQHYGFNTKLLKEIVDFWKTKYNWKEREQFLNKYPQFTVSVQGLKIHYIHAKPTETKGLKVKPLLLVHGWPGSVREFYEIIPFLITPRKGVDFVFEVIAPSLPGYGFSEGAVRPGLGGVQMAVIFKNLMNRLGYQKYYIQGGDWGSFIVQTMAVLYPEKVIGVHDNTCFLTSPLANIKLLLGSLFPSLVMTKEEESKVIPLSSKYSFLVLESGYFHLQATKPDTVGVALRESPVGLAAYILEKFTSWSNPNWKDLDDGGLTKKFTYTNLLDNVMIYWVTRSITTSVRLYAETFSEAHQALGVEKIPIEVPAACARFSNEFFYTPKFILTGKFKKLIQLSDYDGGHFAAFEAPKALADDIYEFAKKVEALPTESKNVLKDLQQRLANALPFQASLEGAKQHYGINNNLLKEIIDFWKTQYNWREREKFLNQYPQFTVSVQGLRIHYIHVKPTETKGLKVLPLLLLHGWPGSVREFYEMIPLLTTPQKGSKFVFEVIAPSLPGYGFSEAAVRPGLGSSQMAVIFKNFMARLGYERYYVQGGDWGSIIVQAMSSLFPEKIIGVHANMCFLNTPLSNLKLIIGNIFPSLFVTQEEKERVYPLSEKYSFLVLETGYLHLQATKPDTVGVALRDSPVGLAAYIIEKFTTWTNPKWKDLDDGGLTRRYTYTNLLDNVMIYWVTRSITTSMRLYSETFNKAHQALQIDSLLVEVPSGCARFNNELAYLPKSLLKDKYKKLVHVSDLEGGHFAAFEVPRTLANDIYEFTEKVETSLETSNS